jgi:hypothetical protein
MRINITQNDEFGAVRLVGWFDDDKATRYDEDTEFDGSNHISVATGTQWDHQGLYRTAGGRWVLFAFSDYQGTLPTYEFVSEDRAREWLLANSHDAAVAEHFGPVEDEQGPGRPEIGSPLLVRLGTLYDPVATFAQTHGLSKAEAARQLIAAGLTAQVPDAWAQCQSEARRVPR